MKQLATAILVICWIIVLPMVSYAEEGQKERPLTKEELELKKSIDQTRRAMDEMMSHFEKRAREFKYDCLQTTGDESFCECLENKIPVAFSFPDYVTIMISTKEEIGYDNLDPEM